MSDISFVTSRLDGDVAVITIDDGKANAISFAVLEQLNAALDAAETNARAVVILGREGKFSAGFDLKVMTGEVDGARRLLGGGAELGLRLFEFPIPVVLGVTGHALAMGGILITTADYRVGADGPFKIGLNEVAIGMPVPMFAVELCRDRLSKTYLTRSLQHAELFAPSAALAANYLDEVVEADQVAARSIEVAARLAATVHPKPFAVTRKIMRRELAARIRSGLENDLALFTVER
ncbi:MAG: crotonase/enoyl-CoA hydratase family protein [Actinobacteria bacterium]|nr:crotonase/enoyl-CoA hydratase family protein [Actinomycetota bacterium]